ncbi:MAG: efflux RND transporter periplasmic adaptor subunit, partial [Halioglobus sp.]|nr:efflux RND transporter periplasmic adaptor subunit [Halioglobus sp.]
MAALALAGPPLSAAPLPPVDCVITPYTTVELSSPIPGALAEVLAERSDQVTRGQVVARMYSGVEQATVSLARERSTMKAEVELESVNLAYDLREQKRLSSLYTDNLVAQKALDDAERSYALTGWKLQQSRDLLRLRALELQRAQALLEQKWIRSPIDGVVTQRYKQAGEYVEDQAILQIAELDTLAVEAIVPMELFYSIENGMSADVYSEITPSRPVRAVVSVVDRMGDASSGTFGVRLTLPNEDLKVPAGVKCTVQFLPDEPLTALAPRSRPSTEGLAMVGIADYRDNLADLPTPTPAPKPAADWAPRDWETVQREAPAPTAADVAAAAEDAAPGADGYDEGAPDDGVAEAAGEESAQSSQVAAESPADAGDGVAAADSEPEPAGDDDALATVFAEDFAPGYDPDLDTDWLDAEETGQEAQEATAQEVQEELAEAADVEPVAAEDDADTAATAVADAEAAATAA